MRIEYNNYKGEVIIYCEILTIHEQFAFHQFRFDIYRENKEGMIKALLRQYEVLLRKELDKFEALK